MSPSGSFDGRLVEKKFCNVCEGNGKMVMQQGGDRGDCFRLWGDDNDGIERKQRELNSGQLQRPNRLKTEDHCVMWFLSGTTEGKGRVRAKAD